MTAHAMAGDREQCLQAGMDGYVSKPVRSRELMAAIERALAATDGAAPVAKPTGAACAPVEEPATAIDWSAAREAVQGDESLLAELVSAFLEECPTLMEEIARAVEDADCAALRLAAHRLKGSMRYFGATRAFDQAFILETIGREGRMADAAAPLETLQSELERLQAQLREHAAVA
jgi:HPt (histidine-containing phosphotransfer) domain-containing protein